MSLELLCFFMFAAITTLSAIMVVSAKNPVHAVLFLILAFFNAAGLFLLAGAEFLSMILVIVYVGAVAVLFLFVVMMLDVDFAAFKQGFMKYLPIGGTVGGILLVELVMGAQYWMSAKKPSPAFSPMPDDAAISNSTALGRVLYTDYFLAFQLSGVILLVAMIGAIVLTLRDRSNVLRQNIAEQVYRDPGEAMEMRKVASRTGVTLD